MGQVDGKIALVTGGGSGIGRATAKALAGEGARVVVTDIDEAGGRETVETIGAAAVFKFHDVTQEDRWRDVIDETLSECDGLHVLVNNAGIGITRPIVETTLEEWRRQQSVNVEGVFLGVKYAIPAIRDSGGGSIVNLSSIAGLKGNGVGLGCYSATKGAVRLFTKSAALECAHAGWPVRVNSVHPGVIDTAIWPKLAAGAPLSNNPKASNDPTSRAAASVPGGVLGRPEDVANAIVFLASDKSSYMTGSEVVVDHGIMAG